MAILHPLDLGFLNRFAAWAVVRLGAWERGEGEGKGRGEFNRCHRMIGSPSPVKTCLVKDRMGVNNTVCSASWFPGSSLVSSSWRAKKLWTSGTSLANLRVIWIRLSACMRSHVDCGRRATARATVHRPLKVWTRRSLG